jgi:hypothetical protein
MPNGGMEEQVLYVRELVKQNEFDQKNGMSSIERVLQQC